MKSWCMKLLVVLVVLLCAACGKSTEQQVAEQLELGQRYLEEMDYEQAIIAFTKTIGIDEKNIDALVGRASAYIALADIPSENEQELTEEQSELLRFASKDYLSVMALSDESSELYFYVHQSVEADVIDENGSILETVMLEIGDVVLYERTDEKTYVDMRLEDERPIRISVEQIEERFLVDGEEYAKVFNMIPIEKVVAENKTLEYEYEYMKAVLENNVLTITFIPNDQAAYFQHLGIEESYVVSGTDENYTDMIIGDIGQDINPCLFLLTDDRKVEYVPVGKIMTSGSVNESSFYNLGMLDDLSDIASFRAGSVMNEYGSGYMTVFAVDLSGQEYDLSEYIRVMDEQVEQLLGTDGQADQSSEWKKAYIDYMQQAQMNKEPWANETTGCLIYVNDDDVPELYLDYGSTAAGGEVCTYYNGEIHTIVVWCMGVSYIERENLMWDNGGKMDEFYNTVYQIINGEFIQLHKGEFGIEDYNNVQFDANEMPIYQYYWDGIPVLEEEYQQELNLGYEESEKIDLYGKMVPLNTLIQQMNQL